MALLASPFRSVKVDTSRQLLTRSGGQPELLIQEQCEEGKLRISGLGGKERVLVSSSEE